MSDEYVYTDKHIAKLYAQREKWAMEAIEYAICVQKCREPEICFYSNIAKFQFTVLCNKRQDVADLYFDIDVGEEEGIRIKLRGENAEATYAEIFYLLAPSIRKFVVENLEVQCLREVEERHKRHLHFIEQKKIRENVLLREGEGVKL